jgi:hypothetical protein
MDMSAIVKRLAQMMSVAATRGSSVRSLPRNQRRKSAAACGRRRSLVSKRSYRKTIVWGKVSVASPKCNPVEKIAEVRIIVAKDQGGRSVFHAEVVADGGRFCHSNMVVSERRHSAKGPGRVPYRGRGRRRAGVQGLLTSTWRRRWSGRPRRPRAALVLTVDRQGGRNTETLFRLRRQDDRNCVACHAGGFQNEVPRKPMFSGIDVSHVNNLYGTGMTREFVKRLSRHHQDADIPEGDCRAGGRDEGSAGRGGRHFRVEPRPRCCGMNRCIVYLHFC